MMLAVRQHKTWRVVISITFKKLIAFVNKNQNIDINEYDINYICLCL